MASLKENKKKRKEKPTIARGAPAGDAAAPARVIPCAPWWGEAGGLHVGAEGDGALDPDQGHVIVMGRL